MKQLHQSKSYICVIAHHLWRRFSFSIIDISFNKNNTGIIQMNERLNISSGAKWENIVGYSRAVKIGNVVEVSGTAPVEEGKTLFPGNAYEQTKACIKIINKALEAAGASLSNVIRTRMFVTDISRWEEFGKAHAEFFKDIKPATSMVEVKSLISPDMLIEIEATAIVE